MSRLLPALLGVLALAPAASASPGLRLGFDDDTLKWMTRPNGVVGVQRDLGVRTTRITIPWRRGELPRPIRGMLVEVAPGSDETEIAAAGALVEALRDENLQVEGPVPMDPNARNGSWTSSDADVLPAVTLTIGAK